MTNKKHKLRYLITGILFLVFCFAISLFLSQEALAAPPASIYLDLGSGAFPDVVWHKNRLYIAYRSGNNRAINLYSYDKDLKDKKTEKIINLSQGAGGFPRLATFNDTIWLAYRDGEASGEDIKLWRQDTNTTESLGPGIGNDPVALGYGYIVWQKCEGSDCADSKVYKRLLTGGAVTVIQTWRSTGISRVLPDGSIKMIEEDATAVSWGLRAWFAGKLTVATDVTPRDDNGIVGRFEDDPSTEFNLWSGQRAHTPHAATDGFGNYAVATWNPTVRVAVFTGPTGGGELDCDPMPEDLEQIEACVWQLTIQPPSGPVYPPGSDPENPTALDTSGMWGVDLAYNSKNNTILVASYGKKSGDDGIFGSILNADDLKPVKSSFKIDQGPTSFFAGTPRTIYNSEADKFFVAWEDERPATNRRSVYGRFLAGDGALLGNDFAIINNANTFLRNVLYNFKDKKYAVVGENTNINLFVVESSGAVSKIVNLRIEPGLYEGQPEFTFNSGLNEYWVTYVQCAELGTSVRPKPDCQDKLIRVNASTNQVVGLQLLAADHISPGVNVGAARIAYSPDNLGAMIVWDGQENGIFGRTLSNDLIFSEPFPLLTPELLPYADGYGAPDIEYSADSKTFFMSAQDNNAGNITVEFDYSGFIYDTKQPLAPPVAFNGNPANWLAKLFGIKFANAGPAYGNYNPRITTGNGRVYVGASQNYTSTVVSSAWSAAGTQNFPQGSPAGNNPPATTSVDTSSLSKLINQIYVYALGAAALLALLMMILGGYYRMTAAGNAQQAQKGTEIIMSSLVGIVLLFGSYLLLNTINPDLVKLDFSSIDQLNQPPAP